ncbi:ATP-binding cassette domain-containing protein [Bacillus sp. C1]
MLSLNNIRKKFGNETVLHDLSAEFTGGLNFILGPSGSGKSTLLKIISGMDNDFEGDVRFKDQSLKGFSTPELNNYYYNSVGFIWQNFQLLNHLSVEDNVKLIINLSPLSAAEKDKKVRMMLNRLEIGNLAKTKVSKLSGGQKQRVAIARALIKDPEIIIADEPTGALDAASSKVIIDLLRKIAKEKLVIIVTHDKSLIDKDSNSFLLKGGKLEKTSFQDKAPSSKMKDKWIQPTLSFKDAIIQAFKNIKGLSIKFSLTAAMLILSSFFLLMNVSGNIQEQQDDTYNELVKERGDSIRDIYLTPNSTSTGGNANGQAMEQDTSKAYELLKESPGIDYMYTSTPLANLNINIGDIVKDYKPETSNVSPTVQNLIAGKMPAYNKMEVAIPKIVLDELNLKPKDVIGKKLSMTGAMNSRSLGASEVSLNDLTVSGVIDTNFYNQMELKDAFIYSLQANKEIFKQANVDTSNLGVKIRAKTLEDILPLVDKLQKAGLSPQGDFSSIQDMLNLKATNEDQGSSISTIFLVLSIVITLALTVINSYLRKNEHAILKINGYNSKSILNLTIFEYLQVSLLSSIVFLITFPVLNIFSTSLFNMSVSGKDSLLLGVAIMIAQGLVIGVISSIMSATIKPSKNLKIGDV